MKARMIFSPIGLFLLFIFPVFISCAKSDNTEKGQARFQVFLADDPGDYEEVLIDVQDIQVNLKGDNDDGWQSLAGVNSGTYDLLRLVNDQDTLLADATIPSGRLHQLRLILGTENYVKVNGTMIKLNTPVDQQAGLKLNIQQDVLNGILFKILLDFDVAKSIVATGSGSYNLKPTIRTVFESVGGSLKGWVNPGDSATLVYAIQSADTIASTRTGLDGGYVIRGLAQGSYMVYFNPSGSTYRDSIIAGINVVNKEVAVIDTMFLQP
ncbi:MAG: DUF4382 domain-containing protein [Chitinophagaceae bacterium]